MFLWGHEDHSHVWPNYFFLFCEALLTWETFSYVETALCKAVLSAKSVVIKPSDSFKYVSFKETPSNNPDKADKKAHYSYELFREVFFDL